VSTITGEVTGLAGDVVILSLSLIRVVTAFTGFTGLTSSELAEEDKLTGLTGITSTLTGLAGIVTSTSGLAGIVTGLAEIVTELSGLAGIISSRLTGLADECTTLEVTSDKAVRLAVSATEHNNGELGATKQTSFLPFLFTPD